MRIDDIDALLATVQFSSLNQAAEYLGITQSAITRRLQRLEQELNVTLLERQTRPLTLTAAGHRVYEQCLSIKRETKKLYSLLDPEGAARRPASRRAAESQRDCPAGGAVGAEPAVSRTVAADRLRLERTAAAPAGKRRAGRHAGDGARPAKLRRGLQRAPAVSPGGGADRRPAFEFARVIPAGVRRTGLDP